MKKDTDHYYTCDRFAITELVPQEIWLARGEKAWQLFDVRFLENLDELAIQLGVPLVINNWKIGGPRQWSGLRIHGCPYFSQTSQHTYGRAADPLINGKVSLVEADAAREKIASREIILPHPCTFEVNVGWLHMDTRQSTDLITFVDTQKVVWRFNED